MKIHGKDRGSSFLREPVGPRSALPGGASLQLDYHGGGQKVEYVEFFFLLTWTMTSSLLSLQSQVSGTWGLTKLIIMEKPSHS